ncbi:hypothetical protein K488DRAFT_82940 [Vararia minispora EC-137]|uniref:Uncharacterized protein n=1 Tax=Vararia minispora EC-137 TaxID=1314806 RepID=A0ACB8QVF9_9AGAM|nr:hypothetical protein K488DRAFT_82940 [Vararia minispora EC-137]
MSLNDFLADDALGSWADEMDSLPTAPAARDDDRGDRRGGRDDYLSSRPERAAYPPREDLPLPTQPPYTAFIGNMAFDLTEADLETFFEGLTVKSAKVIKDRDDRPKGFGYVEFAELDDLKAALAKSGMSLAGRTVRISVAEPPKERPGFGGSGGGFDDAKFAGDWRRSGPLPDLPGRGGDGPRRRFDGPGGGDRMPPPPSVADNADQWRSSRASRPPPQSEQSEQRRRPGFFAGEQSAGTADREETWTRGSRFRPSEAEPEREQRRGGGFGSGPRRDEPPPSAASDGDWRSARPPPISRGSTSPSSSTPPTPQFAGRRKLELLPRSGAASASPSPLASPKLSQPAASKASPFGEAKPVDVTARENAVAERLEREREAVASKAQGAGHTMSRNTSRTGSQRGTQRGSPSSAAGSPRPAPAQPANVRPAFSFAAAASSGSGGAKGEDAELAEQLGEVTI